MYLMKRDGHDFAFLFHEADLSITITCDEKGCEDLLYEFHGESEFESESV